LAPFSIETEENNALDKATRLFFSLWLDVWTFVNIHEIYNAQLSCVC